MIFQTASLPLRNFGLWYRKFNNNAKNWSETETID